MTFSKKKILSALDVQEDQQRAAPLVHNDDVAQEHQHFVNTYTIVTTAVTYPAFGQVDMADNDNISSGRKRSATSDGEKIEDDDQPITTTSPTKPEGANKKLRTETIEEFVQDAQMPGLTGNMEVMEEIDVTDEKTASKGTMGTDRSVGTEEDDDEAQGRIEGETIWDERFRMFLNFKKTFG